MNYRKLDVEHTEQILRRIERNDHTLKKLDIGFGGSIFKYGPPDLSRLGTVIANNTNLDELGVIYSEHIAIEVTDENFLNGLKQNTSIQKLSLDLRNHSIVGTIMHVLLRAYQENSNLTDITIEYARRDDHHIITNTLMRNTNLRTIRLIDSGITDDQLLQMVEAISVHRMLEYLALSGNNIGDIGCQALATLLEDPNCNIRALDLSDNDIGVVAAVALANSLATNTKLRKLDLSQNDTIFVALADDPYDSDGGYLSDENYLDLTVQASFCQILCNKSSIGATYSSNHTLETIYCGDAGMCGGLPFLLQRNRLANKSHVAMIKLLDYHPNIDMQPMFEWDAEGEQTLKALPYVISWFKGSDEAVAVVEQVLHRWYKRANDALVGHLRYHIVAQRKLSAIFQIALAMPLLFVPASHIKVDSKKRKRDDNNNK